MKKKKVGKKKRLPKVRKISRIYEQRYFYILGVIILLALFVVGVKIVSSFAYQIRDDSSSSTVRHTAKPTKAPLKSPIKSSPPKPPAKPTVAKTLTFECTNFTQFEAKASKQDIVHALASQFNISLQGNQESGKNQAWQIYTTMCLLNNDHAMSSARSRFLQLAMIPTRHINIQLSVGRGCIEGSSYYANKELLELGWCGADKGSKAVIANRFTLVHELGHFIHYRQDHLPGGNKNLFANFVKTIYGSPQPEIENYFKHPKFFDNASGDVPNRLPTTNCWFATKPEYGPWMESECYSDMIAEYVVYNSYFQGTNLGYSLSRSGTTSHCGALANQCGKSGKQNFLEYPTKYAVWYNYAKNYIFGDVEFCDTTCRSKPVCPPSDICLSFQTCKSEGLRRLPQYYCGTGNVCCTE